MGRAVIGAMLLLAVCGCDRDLMSERGFVLPEGEPLAGREAFLYMQCNQCHTIVGEDLPAVPGYEPNVALGGTSTRVTTYGELVTSIINPSHRLASGYAEELVSEGGESNMYVYNRYMTVQELIDLVAFLQPHYKVTVPRYPFPLYPPG
ncbi:MAG: c-type cytochrome [Woeseiaceae bacterium]|nr:c-type cytochrome [Woeseiaceae bacterium]